MSYSVDLIERNKEADGKLLGVRLGRACIKKKIPITQVAKELKVSRQTVYNWFSGVFEPTPAVHRRVLAYCSNLIASK
jgi:DNA-binding phage protein